MAAVRLVGITKRFDGAGANAVDGIDLDVADHEFLVLLGPSGCGKSTVLRLIAGLEESTAGEVWIGDRRVDGVAPRDRDVAMVFQSYALYPQKTVLANVAFPLKARGVGKAQREAKARHAAESLGLGELLGRKPAALSGGQRQRVALARAIVREPAVFLMDEPLSNLDAKLRGETRAELVALHARLEATFLYVTHDQVEAMTMGQRVAVIDRGRLQQVGPPQEVYDRPANVFVAQFLGTPPMNVFLPGVFERGDHHVGVRPEHLAIGAAGPLEATVTLVESLGFERLVHCQLGSGQKVLVRETGAEAPTPAVGASVCLDADPQHRHRFDATTGDRLPDRAAPVELTS